MLMINFLQLLQENNSEEIGRTEVRGQSLTEELKKLEQVSYNFVQHELSLL